MSALTAIHDYMQVSARVATAGQPNLDQLELIADAGYQAVINLAPADSAGALDNEAQWVNQLGMVYISIPVDFAAPAEQDFVRFVNAMNLHQNDRVFVHCEDNRRVSVFMALYQMLTGELGGEAAWLQIKCIWQPDNIWQGFIDRIRDQFKTAIHNLR